MMTLINPFQENLGRVTCDGADFNGVPDYSYMSRGADLTGIADSKTGILSMWLVIDSNPVLDTYWLTGSTATETHFKLAKGYISEQFVINGRNASNTTVLSMSSYVYSPSADWLHLLASWDLATGTTHLYMSDVSDNASPYTVNDTIDYTVTDWAIGADLITTTPFRQQLAEVYFAPGQYLDFSDEKNRRKFITSGGKPVYLGADGSLPTGTAPIIYQHIDDGEAIANFATNRGTGGNFTITGALATASTSPSD